MDVLLRCESSLNVISFFDFNALFPELILRAQKLFFCCLKEGYPVLGI